jgi:hypothetical protein
LCGKYSNKKYALGRGIASHLDAVHTPWNPSKLAKKIQRRQGEELEREERKQKRRKNDVCSNQAAESTSEPWEPTQQEIEDWNGRILQIVKQVETNCVQQQQAENASIPTSRDRNGRHVESYRKSLPQFLEAASNGDMEKLRALVEEVTAKEDTTNMDALTELLDTKDRHCSTAEHWAAGGGHLDCVKFILDLRKKCAHAEDTTTDEKMKRARRRDGKTCLHYAARNGHLECVRYLVEEAKHPIDEASGEGSTPLHMACYGGQAAVAKYLIDHGADALSSNEWGCNAAHWAGMTISKSASNARELCTLLKVHCVSFVEKQQQGHTALHKAALRLNEHVIQWMADPLDVGGAGLSKGEVEAAGCRDLGGHCSSDIWRNVGGRADFAKWMQGLGW